MDSPQKQVIATNLHTVYFAGGCLWGVQEFMRQLPGVVVTEAGRANGSSPAIEGDYDGYAECVKTRFDASRISIGELLAYFFEIIDPYSVNRQGQDVGEKYRTGVYSDSEQHLQAARQYIEERDDAARITIEVLPLSNYIPSDEEHQDRLSRFPDDYCHIPLELLHKYKGA